MPSYTSTAWNISEFEWDEGLTMPVSNAENKKLEEKIQYKQKLCTSLSKELQENENRVEAVSSHLKNVRQQLLNTQALVAARNREIESEEHMQKVALREEDRLQHEIVKLNKQQDVNKEKKNFFENNIFRQMQRLEEMKSQMNWDQQTLEAWLEEAAKKDSDAMILEKYTRQDEAKVKELMLKIEHLTDECRKKKKKLDIETNQTRTVEVILDQTAEEFRKAHANRDSLISQWEKIIDQMQRRDAEIDMLGGFLGKLNAEAREREETIAEQMRFLEGEKMNNVEAEKRIAMAERMAAKLRLDHQQTDLDRDQFQNELDALKRTVDRTALDLEMTRSDVKQTKKSIIDKTARVEKMKAGYELLQDRMRQAEETHLSAEEKASRMEESLDAEKAHQVALEHRMKQARTAKFIGLNELLESQMQERDNQAGIQGGHAALRNLRSKVNRLDQDSIKQQEIIYNQEFGIQQLERRLARLAGEQTNDEQVALEAKIKELTAQLDQKVTKHRMLQSQYKQLQEDICHVRIGFDQSTKEKSTLTMKIEELELHIENALRAHKVAITTKEEMLVKENLLRLELRRLRTILLEHADGVNKLGEKREHLDAAVHERRGELRMHADMLAAQIRAADGERQQISSELHARLSGIDKLTKRYESLMITMAPPEGEEDRSQAYYVIKAAQEKEELQRHGDSLDANIRKAEREIRALENTLRLMNGRNETYRKSFNKITDSSAEMDEKHELEEQMRAVMDKHKYKRRQIRELYEDLQTMSNSLDQLARDHAAYNGMTEDKKTKIIQLRKEITEQQAKLDRVSKQNAKYTRDLRKAEGTKAETELERDFEIRLLRETNKKMMREIGAVVHDYPGIASTVQMYFAQAELPPPSPSSSVASSVSTRRSGSHRSSTLSDVALSSPTGSASSLTRRAIQPTSAVMTPIEMSDAISGRLSRTSDHPSRNSTCSSSRTTVSRVSKCSSHCSSADHGEVM